MAAPSPSAGRVSRVAVVATGSRADLQPYLALASGLQRAGFEIRVVTHAVHRDEVTATGSGLQFCPIKGDPSFVLRSAAFRAAVLEGSMIRVAALFKADVDAHIEENMRLIYDACRPVDLILCSIAVLTECCAIAQKMQIPVILCPQLPFSPSGEVRGGRGLSSRGHVLPAKGEELLRVGGSLAPSPTPPSPSPPHLDPPRDARRRAAEVRVAEQAHVRALGPLREWRRRPA